MKNVKNIVLMIAVIAIVFFLLVDRCARKKQLKYFKEKQQLENKILNDSLISIRFKNGVLKSEINVLESSSKKSFLDIKSKDSMIIRLQKEVKNNNISGGSATVFSTITKFDTIIQTDSVYFTNTITDTIVKDSLPTYAFNFNDSWIKIEGNVNNEKTKIGVIINNDYSVIIKKQKKKYVAVVINDNPYSTTKEVQAYKLKMPKPKRFGIGMQAGYGINARGLSPYVGIGLSYNILKF